MVRKGQMQNVLEGCQQEVEEEERLFLNKECNSSYL